MQAHAANDDNPDSALNIASVPSMLIYNVDTR
jgi:hypothetical protein